MGNEVIGIVGLVALLALMFLRVPIGVCFALVGGIGTVVLASLDGGLTNFALVPYTWTSQYSFSVVPMFVLMGFVIAVSNVARDLYASAYAWVGRLPGGLAIATLVVTALFSAISGSAVVAATTIAIICYPEMKKLGYHPRLSTGVIAAGATMDIMIPPSVPMIILALAADMSVGRLMLAGFVPGILEVLLFSLVIVVMVKRNPSLAPASVGHVPFVEKLKGLRSVLPILAIFLLVFGGLYGGVFTATEAGAFGVVSSIGVCLLLRRLRWRELRGALLETVRLTGTIFIVLIGVMLFNTFVALSGLSTKLSELVVSLGVSPAVFLLSIVVLYLILGAVMEEIGMIMLTIPLFLPMVKALGIDPIHFGILVILAWQIGAIAPPVGMVVFVTQSALSRDSDVSIETVYKGSLPFLAVLLFLEAIVALFPALVLLPLTWMK